MMTITDFSENKSKQTNGKEVRIPDFGKRGKNKGFWPEYLPMLLTNVFITFG